MTKLFTLAFLLQCLSMSLLIANDGNAQVKSIEEVRVHLTLKEVKVERAFKELEKNTEYNFVFASREIKDLPVITFESRGRTVYDILSDIAAQTDLRFKQVDSNIHVQKNDKKQPVSILEVADITVRGVVVDDKGEPLPGASVTVAGTATGTVTDIDGNYSITVPDGATLIFSYIGFESMRVSVENRSQINVTLKSDMSSLDEVVVVGYGTMRKSDLTGSVSQVKAKDIENRFTARIEDALQGQMAGVSVQQTSAIPGAAPVVRVRGTNSITEGNQPLWVIDGMPIEDLNIIVNFNMSDAESIEVLKDAASAAIYGSRGANGVILVTTKKGKSGTPTISFNMRYGIQEPEKLIEFVSGPEMAEINAEYRAWFWEERLGRDPNVPNANRPAQFRIDPNWLTGNVPDYDIQRDYLFRTAAPIQNYNISLNGGSDNTTYFMSLDYMDQEGIAQGSSFERFSIRTNIESKVNNWIDIGLNVSASSSTQIDANLEGKDQEGNFALRVGNPLVDYGDYYFPENSVVPQNDYALEYGFRSDPFRHYRLFNTEQKWIRPQALVNSHINFHLIEGLTLKVAGYYSYNSRVFSEQQDMIANRGNPRNYTSNFYGTNWTLESTLNYNKQIGKHSVTGLLGYSSQKDYGESRTMNGQGFPNDLSLTMNNATEIFGWGQGINEWSLISMFARGTYAYDGRYLLSASVRRDGSSRFGPDNRWGVFPAVSAAWNISNEAFLSDNSSLSNLKLRISYGETGNNRIGNYRHFPTMANANAVLGAGENLVAGLRPGAFENRDLTWEKTGTTNIGLDMGFLRDRINLSIDAYRALTTDLLLDVPLPLTAGFSSTIFNIGEVENRGIEVELNTGNIVTSDFQWTTSFNISYNKNEVLKLGPNNAQILTGPWFGRVSMTQVGHPIGSFYMWQTDGIFQNQEELDVGPIFRDEGVGDIRWKDVNGDGVVDQDDKSIVGQPMPVWTFGLTNNLSYKNFDLSIFINGAGGHQMYNVVSRYYNRAQNFNGNLMKRWATRWRSEDDPGNGYTPKITSIAGTNGTDEEHDGWLHDADWWRIKNVTIGYTLPGSLLSKIKISRLRVYATAENLFLGTDYVGYNPEGTFGQSQGNRGASQGEAGAADGDWGYDYGTLPQPRTYAVGLNLTF